MQLLELEVSHRTAQQNARDVLKGSACDPALAQIQWANFVKRNFADFSFGLAKEPNFTINARSRTCHEFMVARLCTLSGKLLLQRGPREIQEDQEDRYAVYLPVRGTQRLFHFGREVECGPGVISLVSMSEPLRQIKNGDNDTLYFLVPKKFLDMRVVWRAESCAHSISIKNGIWRLAVEAIRGLYAESESMSDEEFTGIARRIADLVAFAMQGGAHDSIATDSVRHSNLARVKRIIRARLQDPDLTLTAIAQQCGISLRYLHRLFEAEGQTAQEYLRGERLQFARRMLETAAYQAITVTDVALASGFVNLSHFSTAFKNAFGCSPRDVLKEL